MAALRKNKPRTLRAGCESIQSKCPVCVTVIPYSNIIVSSARREGPVTLCVFGFSPHLAFSGVVKGWQFCCVHLK